MKTILRPSVFVCLSIVLGASVAAAHHAVQAQFDVNDVQTFTGTMTEVELINPHPYFHLDVETPGGEVVNWSIESVALNALRRMGCLSSYRSDWITQWSTTRLVTAKGSVS